MVLSVSGLSPIVLRNAWRHIYNIGAGFISQYWCQLHNQLLDATKRSYIMRSRAIRDLVQLPDAELFAEVSKGLAVIFENATRIAASVQILAKEKQYRGAKILEAISDEEAAKYLILLDAIRCPRKPERRLSDQLDKFNQHLAKGIYADACAWRPIDFSEVRENIVRECQQYYLDGPNDIDWIFENWIIRQREEAFYVDYVEYDKRHEWISPERYEAVSSGFFFSSESPAIKLVSALHEIGVSKPESLEVIAEIWRPLTFTDQSKHDELRNYNIKTLQKLREEGLLNNGNEEAYSQIVEFWLFPLYDCKMRQIQVKKLKLKEIQDRWYPEY